ncbi:hypothetical protein M8C21_028061, partial [Ambrosia artemisiifolia]
SASFLTFVFIFSATILYNPPPALYWSSPPPPAIQHQHQPTCCIPRFASFSFARFPQASPISKRFQRHTHQVPLNPFRSTWEKGGFSTCKTWTCTICLPPKMCNIRSESLIVVRSTPGGATAPVEDERRHNSVLLHAYVEGGEDVDSGAASRPTLSVTPLTKSFEHQAVAETCDNTYVEGGEIVDSGAASRATMSVTRLTKSCERQAVAATRDIGI